MKRRWSRPQPTWLTLLFIPSVYGAAPTPAPMSKPTRAIDHEVSSMQSVLDHHGGHQVHQGGDNFKFPYDDVYTSIPMICGLLICCFGVLYNMRDFWQDKDFEDPLWYGTLDNNEGDEFDDLLDDGDGADIELIGQSTTNPMVTTTASGGQMHHRQARAEVDSSDSAFLLGVEESKGSEMQMHDSSLV